MIQLSHSQISVDSSKLYSGSPAIRSSTPGVLLSQVFNIKDMWQVDPLVMSIQDYFAIKVSLLK
jgi:hypothetical protein